MRWMFSGWLACVVVVFGAGCFTTKQNPALCCTSNEDCDAAGVPRETGCAKGLACKAHVCVPQDCEVDADCPTNEPVCHLNVCVECDDTHACAANAPVCAPDNTCHGCTDSAACSEFDETPVCQPDNGSCVECVGPTDCPQNTPACIGGACGLCISHSDCPSGACLPDGTCGNDTNVAFVDSNGTTNTICARQLPCNTIALGLVTNRVHLKLKGNFDEAVDFTARDVNFLAEPGTTLTNRTAGGAAIRIRSNSHVQIQDMTISNARNAQFSPAFGIITDGVLGCTLRIIRSRIINNAAAGIDTGCKLDMRDSVVAGNAFGGIACHGTICSIVNTVIVSNGNGSSNAFGGVFLTQDSSRFEFNTVVDNLDRFSARVGVTCLTVATTIIHLANNIFLNDAIVGETNCPTDHSLFATGSTVTGTNLAGDPKFKNTSLLNAAASDFYRLAPGSAAIDAADPEATEARDIDGDARPQGGRRDIGADEFKP